MVTLIIGVIRWAPFFLCVLLMGPRHLQRAQQPRPSSQACSPPLSLGLLLMLTSPDTVLSFYPNPVAALFSSRRQRFNGLSEGLPLYPLQEPLSRGGYKIPTANLHTEDLGVPATTFCFRCQISVFHLLPSYALSAAGTRSYEQTFLMLTTGSHLA